VWATPSTSYMANMLKLTRNHKQSPKSNIAFRTELPPELCPEDARHQAPAHSIMRPDIRDPQATRDTVQVITG
jgi:hypothetical protein